MEEEGKIIISNILKSLENKIIGQKEIIQKICIGLFAQGHILLEGVPGIAKTLILKNIASLFNFSFKRIQFTPDLLPSDITGSMVFNPTTLTFNPYKGPIFNSIILADEINRAPAKVQSALLQAMQEKEVNIGGENYKLPNPFFVVATQNPIEHEGTYPLPEAQLDRFMFKILINYPKKEEEFLILKNIDKIEQEDLAASFNQNNFNIILENIKKIYCDDRILNYITDIVESTRNQSNYALSHLSNYIQWGVSPRASISLLKASKVKAFFEGRNYVIPEDVKYIVHEVLRHRIILSYEAIAENINTDNIIDDIIEHIQVK
ncbi:MAG TPA: MoxR family ATPase [Exilispira sp.]|nr:MoxR family ATPase [Exilispira sp.]